MLWPSWVMRKSQVLAGSPGRGTDPRFSIAEVSGGGKVTGPPPKVSEHPCELGQEIMMALDLMLREKENLELRRISSAFPVFPLRKEKGRHLSNLNPRPVLVH